MKINVGWKILAFVLLLITSIISAGGWDYIKSNIPRNEAPYETIGNEQNVGKDLGDDKVDDDIVEVISNDWYYKDKDIEIKLDMVMENNVTFYVADIKLSDVQYLKKGFANNKFGNGNRGRTSEIAKAHNAILAVNGDYYSARDYGIIVKDGIVYRNKPKQEMLAIFDDGRMEVYHEKEVDLEELISEGLQHTFSFGPALVVDGKAIEDFSMYKIRIKNPRTAIGMIEPLHYVFITVDGRQEGYSVGMTFNELAEEFEKRGCKVAYNLDGGGTASMYFNGRLVNRPCDLGGERRLSDIVFIGR